MNGAAEEAIGRGEWVFWRLILGFFGDGGLNCWGGLE